MRYFKIKLINRFDKLFIYNSYQVQVLNVFNKKELSSPKMIKTPPIIEQQLIINYPNLRFFFVIIILIGA